MVGGGELVAHSVALGIMASRFENESNSFTRSRESHYGHVGLEQNKSSFPFISK